MSYWTPPLLSQKCFFFHIWHLDEECHFLIGRLCQRRSFQSHCLSQRLHLNAHEIISILESNDPLRPLSDKSLLHSLFECFLASYCITLLLWSLLLPYWAVYIFPKCHVSLTKLCLCLCCSPYLECSVSSLTQLTLRLADRDKYYHILKRFLPDYSVFLFFLTRSTQDELTPHKLLLTLYYSILYYEIFSIFPQDSEIIIFCPFVPWGLVQCFMRNWW